MRYGKAVGALALLTVLLAGLASCGFTYAEGDLSEYLTADDDALSRLSVTLSREWEVTEGDVDEAIRQLLYQYKSAVNGELEETGTPIGEGDEVAFYFSLTDAEGETVTSGHEVGSGQPVLVEWGSDTLGLRGLEDALSGVVPATCTLTESGEIPGSGILYLEYFYQDIRGEEIGAQITPGGIHRVPVAELDALFGAGMTQALTGKALGQWQTVSLTGDYGEGEAVRNFTVRVRCYAREELSFETLWEDRDMTAHLALLYMVDYTVPALTPETVTETIGVCREASDPVEALRVLVRDLLEEEEERVAALEAALWGALEACFTFQGLPEKQAKRARKALETDLTELYDYCRENLAAGTESQLGPGSLDSFDAFLSALYDAPDMTVEEILTRELEAQVREDIIIYYLVRYGGYEISEEALAEGTEEVIASFPEDDGGEKTLLKKYGGREYFESIFLRNYVLDALSQRVTIRYE